MEHSTLQPLADTLAQGVFLFAGCLVIAVLVPMAVQLIRLLLD